MPGINHVYAVPLAFDVLLIYGVKVGVVPKEHNVLRLREDPDQIQHVGNTDGSSFADDGPTLFAVLLENLALGRKPLQFGERNGRWTSDQAIDPESPIR